MLDAKAKEGNGVFARVETIQRVDTTGGKAPSSGCDEEHASAEVRIPYTAVYYFNGR